jgi:hypothetical protein
VRDFSITEFGTPKMGNSQFPWDLLVGFVTQKSQLKIPSKHMEFQKSSSAGFLFFEGARLIFQKSRFYIYPFRPVFFFSSYSALQFWLRLSLFVLHLQILGKISLSLTLFLFFFSFFLSYPYPSTSQYFSLEIWVLWSFFVSLCPTILIFSIFYFHIRSNLSLQPYSDSRSNISFGDLHVL